MRQFVRVWGPALLLAVSGCLSKGDTTINSNGAAGGTAGQGGTAAAAGTAGTGGAAASAGSGGQGSTTAGGTAGKSSAAGGSAGAGNSAGSSTAGQAGEGGAGMAGGPGACSQDGECDDGKNCTQDSCHEGVCQHTEDPTLCGDDGFSCTTNACKKGVCSPTKDNTVCGRGLCLGVAGTDAAGCCQDADGDGHADSACGGDDCNDSDKAIFPGAFETCGGPDMNCSAAPSLPAVGPQDPLTTSATKKSGFAAAQGASDLALVWSENGLPTALVVDQDGIPKSDPVSVEVGIGEDVVAGSVMAVAPRGDGGWSIFWKSSTQLWVQNLSNTGALGSKAALLTLAGTTGRLFAAHAGSTTVLAIDNADLYTLTDGSTTATHVDGVPDNRYYFGVTTPITYLTKTGFGLVGRGDLIQKQVTSFVEAGGDLHVSEEIPAQDSFHQVGTPPLGTAVAPDGDGMFVFAKTSATFGLHRVTIKGGDFVSLLDFMGAAPVPLGMLAEASHLSLLMTASDTTDLAFQDYDRGTPSQSVPRGTIASVAVLDGAAIFRTKGALRAFYLGRKDMTSPAQVATTLVRCR